MHAVARIADQEAITVWTFGTGATDAQISRFESVLTEAEKQRAARFRIESVKRSFVMTRGMLRLLLGYCLNRDPRSLIFEYGPFGKPSLAQENGLHFNVSHSGELSAIAVGFNGEVGIDIEHVRALHDMQQLIERCCCTEEADDLDSLPADEKTEAFYRCWTRKEAYVKAIGDGLSRPLQSFGVTLRANTPARFLSLGAATGNWILKDLPLHTGYAAALVFRSPERPVLINPIARVDDIIP